MNYLLEMGKIDTKAVLWQNVSTRMKAVYGDENLSRLRTEAKIGPGTVSRIKAQGTSVGVDVLDKIAGPLKVQPWQLLHPDCGVASADTQTLGHVKQGQKTINDVTAALEALAVALAGADSADRNAVKAYLVDLCDRPGEVDTIAAKLNRALEPLPSKRHAA